MSDVSTVIVACIGLSDDTLSLLTANSESEFQFVPFISLQDFFKEVTKTNQNFKSILFENDEKGKSGLLLKRALMKSGFGTIPFCVLTGEVRQLNIKKMLQEGVSEIFLKPYSLKIIEKKLRFILNGRSIEPVQPYDFEFKMPLGKRIFDIVFSSLALILLSPLFLITAVLIRIESKGPIFYYSLRVGTGYKIFRFYKFRSMYTGADAKLSSLKHLNQYSGENTAGTSSVRQRCYNCERNNIPCSAPLYTDNEMWCEKIYKESQQNASQHTFLKIKDDPRVTRIGKIIRNTSIDELPQLWNVLIGDMSIVGNRPLPLYEAEKLTTDKYALRFMAPAGITGLWQVSKRGKGAMSEDERISLDNDYAKFYGTFFDIRLILRTIPALLQKENV